MRYINVFSQLKKDVSSCFNPSVMDNFRRGQHYHVGADAQTSLAISLTEFEQQNLFESIGSFLELVTKSYVVLLKSCPCLVVGN
jgi:hypothetical protein